MYLENYIFMVFLVGWEQSYIVLLLQDKGCDMNTL